MPPGEMSHLGAALAQLPSGWTAYIDNGTSAVLQADRPQLVEATGILGWFGLAVGVLLVPKTIPVRKIRRAFGVSTIPHDGSRDVLMIGDRTTPEHFAWPMLLVEALDQVHPSVAAQVRAAEVGASDAAPRRPRISPIRPMLQRERPQRRRRPARGSAQARRPDPRRYPAQMADPARDIGRRRDR